MYNLEVAQDHTFVVGIGMWVVHNCTVGDANQLMTDAANAPSGQKGMTGVGRAMQKYSMRDGGEVLWGLSRRNTARFSEDGKNFVSDLLNNPDTEFQVRNLGPRYDHYGSGGWIQEARLPDGRGARWTSDWGTFVGLMNP